MAVSKIWPLYQTMDKAVKYICNYDKTLDGTLIDTYKCTERFADYEFKDVAAKARRIKNARIGYHAIVSFPPEDHLSPTRALELGKEIFGQYTGNNFQYVLSVHTDHQEHIHVHCIFNSVSFNDYKKFHIKDKELDCLERLTDKICKENNLSVIEEKSGVKGRGKYEYERHKENSSWKDKLREAIDRNILLSDSYEDFLNRMQYEEGYQIKQGKYLSFTLKHEGQTKSTRNRSLGDFYSIMSIKDRIANKEKYQHIEAQKNEKNVLDEAGNSHQNLEKSLIGQNGISLEHKVNRLVDVDKNKKAKEYAAYRKKLNMININTYAGMINFVKKYHLIYADDFEKVKNELEEKHSLLNSEIRKTYSELNAFEADVKQYEKYLKNMSAHTQYVSTLDKDKKYQLSEYNKKYESALYYFKKNGIKPENVTVKKMKQKEKKIIELRRRLDELKAERKDVKSDISQLTIIQENNRKILGSEFLDNSEKRGMNKSAGKER